MKREYEINPNEWELIFHAPLIIDYNDVVYGLVGTNRSTSPRFDSEKGLYVQAMSNGQYAVQYTMNSDMAAKLRSKNGLQTTLLTCEFNRVGGAGMIPLTIAASYNGQGVPSGSFSHYGGESGYRASSDWATNTSINYFYVKQFNTNARTMDKDWTLMDGSTIHAQSTNIDFANPSAGNLLRIINVYYGNTYTGWLKNVKLYRLKAEL